jgi:hypothetical protein
MPIWAQQQLVTPGSDLQMAECVLIALNCRVYAGVIKCLRLERVGNVV